MNLAFCGDFCRGLFRVEVVFRMDMWGGSDNVLTWVQTCGKGKGSQTLEQGQAKGASGPDLESASAVG